jgi:hypothetical protein
MKELAGRSLFSKSRLTRVIDWIEEASLVQPEHHPTTGASTSMNASSPSPAAGSPGAGLRPH